MTATEYINKTIAELCECEEIETVELSPEGQEKLKQILSHNFSGRIGSFMDEVNVFVGSRAFASVYVGKMSKTIDLRLCEL